MLGNIFSDVWSGAKSVASDVNNYATPWGLVKNVGLPVVGGAFTVTGEAIQTAGTIVRPPQPQQSSGLSPALAQILGTSGGSAGGSSNLLLYAGIGVAGLLLVAALASKRKVAA